MSSGLAQHALSAHLTGVRECHQCQSSCSPKGHDSKRRPAHCSLECATKTRLANMALTCAARKRAADSVGEKICSVCDVAQPLCAFRTRRALSGPRREPECRGCLSVRALIRNLHPVVIRSRRARCVSRYGMSLTEYDLLLDAQGGGCAICGARHADSASRALAVDHCHDSDVVRGLLCSACNRAIGNFKNRPDLLRAAAAYLERIR